MLFSLALLLTATASRPQIHDGVSAVPGFHLQHLAGVIQGATGGAMSPRCIAGSGTP